MKVAKLVYVSLMTRVVVDENATDEEILEKCKVHFIDKIENEIFDHLESIEDDEECPYGTIKSDLN